MTDEAEVWVPVEGWPDYEISSHGQVRIAVDRPNSRWSNGTAVYRKGHLIKQRQRLSASGIPYLFVYLWDGASHKERAVHRLLCHAFHGAPPTPKHHAAHWDGNSLRNLATNIRWATAKENVGEDRERLGRTRKGSAHPNAKLTDDIVREIRRRADAGTESMTVIASEFATDKSTVAKIKRRLAWSHVQ